MPLVGSVAAVVDRVADEVVVDANVGRTFKPILAAILPAIPECRNDHLEAVLVRAPRVGHVPQRHVVGLGEDDPSLADVHTSFVTTYTFLKEVIDIYLYVLFFFGPSERVSQ